MIKSTIFPRLIPHPQLVLQCGTISKATLNSTTCLFATLDIIEKYCVTMAVS